MDIQVSIVLEIYKEEIRKLLEENLLLKAQVVQLQNDLESNKGCE